MPDNPSHVLASHLINQIRSSLSVLEQLNVLPAQDADLIRTKLPPPNGPFPSLQPVESSFGKLAISSPPPPVPVSQQQLQLHQPPAPQVEKRGRALWDYNGNESDDLRFRAGDIIVIDEEVNDQWYRGRVIPQGEQYPRDHRGLFPSNYIEKIDQKPVVPYQAAMTPYQPPPPPTYNPQYQHPGTVIVQQPERKEGRLGKFGETLAHSGVGGLGWGAGSAVGSGLINKIF